MTNLLIKNAKIVDHTSPLNGKVQDILIENGVIIQIDGNIQSKHPIFEAKNLHVSPGWMDLKANFCDPGFEHKETLESGLKSAAKGGFTEVVLSPDTNPTVDNKSIVDYISQKVKGNLVKAHITGSITEKNKGENIAEMYDMHLAGAVAFGCGKNSIESASVLKKALQYVQPFNGLIMHYPHNKELADGGQMHEGETSTMLGLKGIPEIAEELTVARDLMLLDYTKGKLHLNTIGTTQSLKHIKQAKQNKLKITCDIAAHNLLLTDKELETFDSNYKVSPPLVNQTIIDKLITGLKENTIDVIVSDHTPHEEEEKKKEFNHASFGIIGLESAFAVANTALHKHLSIEEIVCKISHNPRKILSLPQPEVKVNEQANITLFSPSEEWTFEKKHIYSKSKNTPFTGKNLIGKPLGCYNNGQLSKN